MKRSVLLIAVNFFFYHSFSQLCGFSELKNFLSAREPGFLKFVNDLPIRNSDKNSAKLSSVYTYTIPIVFHVILNQDQITKLGSLDSLAKVIDFQLNSINQDFSGQNSDSIDIPLPFKSRRGKSDLQFGLAKINPNGQNTTGIDVHIIDNFGFNLSSDIGSGLAYSSAKYTSKGGLNSWDPSAYLNIWILNLLDSGIVSNFLGLTVPPTFVNKYSGIPGDELGIVVSYNTFLAASKAGYRTLTHELGHYFGLSHPWGDDNGLCAQFGGIDDGFDDTPPQAGATYGCVNFPYFDDCSFDGNGIMFMNFMDYTYSSCKNLFTKKQCDFMDKSVSPQGESFGLTQHPKLLEKNSVFVDSYQVYPNPSNIVINILFDKTPEDLHYVKLVNAAGITVYEDDFAKQTGSYSINVANFPNGIYFLYIEVFGQKFVHKITVLN